MFTYREMQSWNSSTIYVSGYRTYRTRYQGQTIGYVRRASTRFDARNMGVGYHWQFSADGTIWTTIRSPWETRDAASEELATAVGAATFPLRTSARTPAGPRGASNGTQGRAFGIEMELTGPSARQIIIALRDAGIRMAARNLSTMRETGYHSTNTQSNVWELKHDGSVHGNGLELVSPKLRGAAGFAAVELVCTTLNAIGASVDRSAGLHVHHDFRGLDVDSIKLQALAFIERESLIMQLVAPSRRTNSTYVPLWINHSRSVDQLRAADRLSTLQYGIGPRGSLNLNAYGVHGSVEIRAHAGTTNAKKITAWVRFGQALFAAAARGAALATNTPEQLLADLVGIEGFTAADAAWLLRFRQAGESRTAIEARVAALRVQIESAESVLEEV